MKSKLIITGILLSLTIMSSAYAKTDITGDTYGEVISTMNMTDGATYGITIEDLNAGENCFDDQICYLEGFSWADAIGWTYWDGLSLQSELVAKFGPGAFPDEYIAKATYDGKLSGFGWGEKYGWVQLSACASIDVEGDCNNKDYCKWTTNYCEIYKTGSLPDVSAQTKDDWGVYIDFCPLKDVVTCELGESNQYCNWDNIDGVCVFDVANNDDGQPFKGYAWSQYLGWIKFGPEVGDTGFNGAFTTWAPDLTPPVFKGIDHAWIPNNRIDHEIIWLEFADENESSVDLSKSLIKVTTIDAEIGGAFEGCPSSTPPDQLNGGLIISHGGLGEAHLRIPKIGQIATPPYGFCAFTLEGVLYNTSGFGYYFGDKGKAAAILDGVDPADPDPNVYEPDLVNLYVRAGELNVAQSFFNLGNPATPIADGNNTFNTTLRLIDIGGNPIMPVRAGVVPDLSNLPEDPSLWIRDVELLYDFSESEYYFDSIDFTRDISLPNPMPIEIENALYPAFSPLQYPQLEPGRPILFGRDYLLDVTGYAPSTTAGNSLVLNNIEFTPLDLELPAVSPSQDAIPANSDPVPTGTAFPRAFNFEPAMDAISGSLTSPFIVVGQPEEATYTLKNISTLNITDFNLDHLFTLRDVTAGLGEQLLEINSINLISLLPGDTTGRTDPESTDARYSLVPNTGAQDFTSFHNTSNNYHPPRYNFNDGLDPEGIYKINGDLYVKLDDLCLQPADPPNPPCPLIDVDRSDPLLAGFDISGFDDEGTFTFGFTPAQYIGETVNAQVDFGITQYISHPASNYPTINPLDPKPIVLYPATPYIDGIELKSVGLATTGTVSGGQVFETGRELDSITTTSSADLRREIRKNVAVLTRTMESCDPNDPPILPTSGELPTSGSCIHEDIANKTVIVYYSGAGTVTLGSGGDISIPSGYKYTLILDQGANLSIESNIVYGDTENSFGMILMSDTSGNGGEVFLHPDPTNIVGLLYAEGSLRSSPDAGASFYYGAGANASDLTNQIYWQGSIVSKNTIGGAPNRATPEGEHICDDWEVVDVADSALGCAQAYDFDFIRRFVTVDDGGLYAPSGMFSGGGQCPGAIPTPNCSIPGTLPSTIKITSGGFLEPVGTGPNDSKSHDTFFIERDNRPVPPGFSSSGGMTSSQEIR